MGRRAKHKAEKAPREYRFQTASSVLALSPSKGRHPLPLSPQKGFARAAPSSPSPGKRPAEASARLSQEKRAQAGARRECGQRGEVCPASEKDGRGRLVRAWAPAAAAPSACVPAPSVLVAGTSSVLASTETAARVRVPTSATAATVVAVAPATASVSVEAQHFFWPALCLPNSSDTRLSAAPASIMSWSAEDEALLARLQRSQFALDTEREAADHVKVLAAAVEHVVIINSERYSEERPSVGAMLGRLCGHHLVSCLDVPPLPIPSTKEGAWAQAESSLSLAGVADSAALRSRRRQRRLELAMARPPQPQQEASSGLARDTSACRPASATNGLFGQPQQQQQQQQRPQRPPSAGPCFYSSSSALAAEAGVRGRGKRPLSKDDSNDINDVTEVPPPQRGPANGCGGGTPFVTAREQLIHNNKKNRNGSGEVSEPGRGLYQNNGGGGHGYVHSNNGGAGRGYNAGVAAAVLVSGNGPQAAPPRRGTGLSRLGNNIRPAKAGFIPPTRREDEGQAQDRNHRNNSSEDASDKGSKVIDDKIMEQIYNEIMVRKPDVAWDDIAGLLFAKQQIRELVIWPILRPDLFTGLRSMGKGLLLFGPPGTGKTLIGKCIASQCNATFFSISAASLTSKWVGEGEKMVRALFYIARQNLPAVIFIDEIDSLLSQRSDSEHEGTRRIKTEFLVQMDGADTDSDERLLLIGATNRPQELDEAARRRLVRRLYIPLPDDDARKQIVRNLLVSMRHTLSEADIDRICEQSSGYSGADVANLCREAAFGPMRGLRDITSVHSDDIRAITLDDFLAAFSLARASVSQTELKAYEDWDKQFGCRG